MAIPAFDEHGYLPAGIHRATLDEIERRFGESNEVKRIEMESLRWLAADCRDKSLTHLLINGSFVTAVAEPNDVDCILLATEAYSMDEFAEDVWLSSYPFLSVKVVNAEDYELFANYIFGTDRDGRMKGVVEVCL